MTDPQATGLVPATLPETTDTVDATLPDAPTASETGNAGSGDARPDVGDELHPSWHFHQLKHRQAGRKEASSPPRIAKKSPPLQLLPEVRPFTQGLPSSQSCGRELHPRAVQGMSRCPDNDPILDAWILK